MISRLMEGTSATAGDLARIAGVSPSSACEHLTQLSQGGLVSVSAQGRRKLFMIASTEIATALEALSLICPPTQVRSLRQSRDASRLAAFRTCYDHLAGSVAVAVLTAMLRQRWLLASSLEYEVTGRGDKRLKEIGVDVTRAMARRRAFARPCLDWTERKSHLAGALGASLAEAFFTNEWARRHASGRGLIITKRGTSALMETFEVDVDGS
jgi:DNA-binding transcriptional ArsR family regulator